MKIGKPKLPRFKMPPPGRVHKDLKKESRKKACRAFKWEKNDGSV